MKIKSIIGILLLAFSIATTAQIKTINRGTYRPNTVRADSELEAWDKANENDVYLNSAIGTEGDTVDDHNLRLIALENDSTATADSLDTHNDRFTAIENDTTTWTNMLQDSLGWMYYDTTAAHIGDYYCAPWGDDSNDGSFDSPWFKLANAANQLSAGDTLYLRGGLYEYDAIGSPSYLQQVNGTPDQKICVFNYPGEKPIIDLSGIPSGSTEQECLYLYQCDYWHIRGLTIKDMAPMSASAGYGIKLSWCKNIRVENCDISGMDGNGMLVYGTTGQETDSIWIVNCDFYDNWDSNYDGDAADGLEVNGESFNVVIDGCRSWSNSDDGFDTYGVDTLVTIKNCWAWDNGKDISGNGEGFKFGSSLAKNETLRMVTNCISSHNRSDGFDNNSMLGHVHLYNNTGYLNGARNFNMGNGADDAHVGTNNLSYDGGAADTWTASSVETNNSWDRTDLTLTAVDFISLDTTLLYTPRLADGSLPDIDFLKLKPESDFTDQGIRVDGVAGIGLSVDIGAQETSSGKRSIDMFNVLDYGAVGDSATDATTAIQAAADAARDANGTLVFPPGVYIISDSISILSDVLSFSAKLVTHDTTYPAVVWPDLDVEYINKTVHLPQIQCTNHSAGYWSLQDQHIGFKVINGNNCTFYIPWIERFRYGIKLTTALSGGNQYSQYYITGALAGNYTSFYLTTGDSNGWTNENGFYHGRSQSYSGDGTDIISGTDTSAHVFIDENTTNNLNSNTFRDISIEGNGHFWSGKITGYKNSMVNCRWESTHPRVKLYKSGASAPANNEFSGMYADDIEFFQDDESSAYKTIWHYSGGMKITGDNDGPFVGANTSSDTYGVFHAMDMNDPTDTVITRYGWRAGVLNVDHKAIGDTYNTIRFKNADGRIFFGNGDFDIANGPYMEYAGDSTIRINDILRLNPRAEPPGSPAAGDIYSDTDGHLYHYDGASWDQLDN